MRIININDSNDFREQSWNLQNETDNQIILSLLESIEHFHAIRFPKKKIIWVTNIHEKEIDYFIELSPLQHPEPQRNAFNETSFFFGGDDDSLYLFSNINIRTITKKPFYLIEGTDKQVLKEEEPNVKGRVIAIDNPDDLPYNELLFMQINHHSKLTFFNCVFHNNTNKKYKIETWHNAVVEFINCDFRGNFIFNSNHDSVIIRH